MMRRWTKDEIEIAWALRRLGGTSIKREENGTLMVYGEDLKDIYFPDIKCGETVNLDDIINNSQGDGNEPEKGENKNGSI